MKCNVLKAFGWITLFIKLFLQQINTNKRAANIKCIKIFKILSTTQILLSIYIHILESCLYFIRTNSKTQIHLGYNLFCQDFTLKLHFLYFPLYKKTPQFYSLVRFFIYKTKYITKVSLQQVHKIMNAYVDYSVSHPPHKLIKISKVNRIISFLLSNLPIKATK